MNTDLQRSKVEILIEQKRYQEAGKLLRELLAQDPNNIDYLMYFAEVNLQQQQYDLALQVIDNAIGLSPATPDLYALKGRIALRQEQYEEAENLVMEAIRLDPYYAEYFALLAFIKLNRKQYQAALDEANKALAIDAQHVFALNTRSTALVKLNQSSQAFETIEGALREDPNNAYTHANYGWGLLEKGDHARAKEHFKQALLHYPNMEYAQMGLLQAIKASNLVYRWFLHYAFLMSKLSGKFQWGILIAFYLGFRILSYTAQHNENLQPYLDPLIFVLAIVAFSTWIITPVSNLFLRFNRYGQLLLSSKEKLSSNFVAASFGIFLIGLACYFLLSDTRYLALAAYGFAMMLPLGVMLAPARKKNALVYYTLALAVLGMWAIVRTFSGGALFHGTTTLFILAFVGFQWFTNYLLIKEDNQ